MNIIEGVFSAMMTPINEDGTINEKETRKLVEFLIEKGVDGIFPVSSVGESAILSYEESCNLMEIVVDQAKDRVKVIPGATSTCARNSIRLAKKAKELGCEAVVISPPYFYPTSQSSIVKHYETISNEVDISIVVYNIPLFSTAIGYDAFKKIIQIPNVIAMKDSSGSFVDYMNFKEIVEKSKKNINLMVGREEFLLGSLIFGSSGCIVASAGIIPEVLVAIKKFYYENKIEKAKKLQKVFLPLVRSMFKVPFPAGFKYASELRGIKMGGTIKALSKEEVTLMEKIKPEIKEKLDCVLNEYEKIRGIQ